MSKNINYLVAVVLSVFVVATPQISFAKKSTSSEVGTGSHNVNGHFKKNGAYVAPHRATNPNQTQRDNYSSKPNVNPHNGKQGTKEPKY